MTKPDSNVSRVYAALRRMAADFELKPDERINESALSLQLGASRTPLREALNRLVAEGFLTFRSGRGFYCRSLSPALVMELYEARVAVDRRPPGWRH
ncbi:GntR family transcriptional regulator [Seohaeicola zhoushanensis]